MLFSLPAARRYEQREIAGYANTCFSLARCYTGMKIQRKVRLPDNLPSNFMIISNHQSFIDIAYLLYAFPSFRLRFVAKENLAHWVPYVSPLFRLQEHALVSRSSKPRVTMTELIKLAKRASYGFCPAIFPEGTRSRTGELQFFHLGAVRTILLENPMPVLCVALDGGYLVSGLSNLLSKMHRVRYKMAVLKLFPSPKGKEDIKNIIDEARNLMERQLEKWHKRG